MKEAGPTQDRRARCEWRCNIMPHVIPSTIFLVLYLGESTGSHSVSNTGGSKRLALTSSEAYVRPSRPKSKIVPLRREGPEPHILSEERDLVFRRQGLRIEVEVDMLWVYKLSHAAEILGRLKCLVT